MTFSVIPPKLTPALFWEVNYIVDPNNVSNQNDAPYVLTKYTLVADIMRDSPRAVELLAEYGIHCVSCYANEIDTLEQGAYVHAMKEDELNEMVEEINNELEKEWWEARRAKSEK